MADQASLDFSPKHDDLKLAAERALASAENLARSSDPGVEGAFDQAESLAVKCPDQDVQMRTFEASARFHEGHGAIPIARKKYRIALDTAECLSVISDAAIEGAARLRFDLVRLDNREDPHFKNLLLAARRDDSRDRLRAAWDKFVADRGDSSGRLAARGFGSVEDFRRRIDAAELDSGDDE
jgi:hypothetical protein